MQARKGRSNKFQESYAFREPWNSNSKHSRILPTKIWGQRIYHLTFLPTLWGNNLGVTSERPAFCSTKMGQKLGNFPENICFFFATHHPWRGKLENIFPTTPTPVSFFFFCSCQFPRKTAKTTFIDSNIKGGFYGPKDIAPGWLLPSGVIILPNPNNAFLQGKFLKITINFVFVWFPPQKWVPFNDPLDLPPSQDSSGKYPGVFGNSLT